MEMTQINHPVRVVGNGKAFIPIEALGSLASVVATQERPTLSSKYRFFSTLDIVEALAGENWLPVLAQEQSVRNTGREGFQKHMIRFRQPSEVAQNLGDIFPELVLTNAHDGLAREFLMAAFMRLACWNGLVVSQALFNSISFRHVGFEIDDVIEASYKVIQDIPKIAERIEDYRKIELTAPEQVALAESALILRFSKAESTVRVDRNTGEIGIDNRDFSVTKLLKAVRTEDERPTLWNTFNVVQEKITKGGDFENTIHKNETLVTKINKKVRAINGINQGIEFNRGLWHLMEEMRQIKSGSSIQIPEVIA
jgi:hypothetical protein